MAVPNPRPGSGVPGQPPIAPVGQQPGFPGASPQPMPGQPYPVPGQFPVPGQPYPVPGQAYPTAPVPGAVYPGQPMPVQPLPGQFPGMPGGVPIVGGAPPPGFPTPNPPQPFPQQGGFAPGMPSATRPAFPAVPQVGVPGAPPFGAVPPQTFPTPQGYGTPQFPNPAAYQGGAVPAQFPGAVPPAQFPGAQRPQFPGAHPPAQFPGAVPSVAPIAPLPTMPGASRPATNQPAPQSPPSKPPQKSPKPTGGAKAPPTGKSASPTTEPPVKRESQPAAPSPRREESPNARREPELAPKAAPSSSGKPDRLSMSALAAVGAAAASSVRTQPLPAEEPETAAELLQRNAIPLLVSFFVHFILIIVLGLFDVKSVEDEVPVIEASTEKPKPPPRVAQIRGVAGDSKTALDTKPRVKLPNLPKKVNVKISMVAPSVSVPTFAPDLPTSDMVAALAGRGLKGELVGKLGGNVLTEEAVEEGLNWLARHQHTDGTWSLSGTDPGRARYSDGCPEEAENREAATAMALLAFFGAGHTPASQSPHAQVIDKAVKKLVRAQDSSGSFFHAKQADDWMYTQALCTMALCEYMALDPKQTDLRPVCERAVKFCMDAQDQNLGGWKYAPRRDSDTSVTGWMLMALQSARNAKINVPQKVFDDITKYLDLAAKGPETIDARTTTVTPGMPGTTPDPTKPPLGSRYSYMPGDNYDHVMTAESLLCRMYLGWAHDDPRLINGCEFLLDKHLPVWHERDVYYWYYGTQAMFHMEGDYFKRWNNALRDTLVAHQQKDGPENGSWTPRHTEKMKVLNREGKEEIRDVGEDAWYLSNRGGRLYVTCFSLYMLEVYYRHLPMYSELKKQMEARAAAPTKSEATAPAPATSVPAPTPSGTTPASS